MAALPVLPDFEVIARSHADLSRELSHCAKPARLAGRQPDSARNTRDTKGDERNARGNGR